MKKLIIALATIMVTAAAYAQGTVQLNNRIGTTVNARVLLPDLTGAGAGITAELGLVGADGKTITALTPTTTFRTSSAAAMGFVNAIDVTVPGVAAGSKATLVLRAYNGASYDASSLKGTSNPVTVSLGGGNLPPAALEGLQGFTLIPEPSTIALGLLGAAALLLRRRK